MTPDFEPDSLLGSVIEEYLSCLERGDRPDREAILEQHGTLRNDLQEFFQNLDLFDGELREVRTNGNNSNLAHWFRDNPSVDLWSSVDQHPSPTIPGFQHMRFLGEGSQGIVYLAKQNGTKRLVALKVIREGAFASPAERRRFDNEVELASRLHHPHIVEVFECGRHADHDYFAMQFIDGEPLSDYVVRTNLAVRSILALFLPVIEAVSYAHQRGVIHRDLKPGNILVDADGVPRILDFGLAKSVGANLRESIAITRVGEFAGTWHYASPEQTQLIPELIDVRTDVYALGVILFELLTDSFPYPMENQTREEMGRNIRETPPVRPSARPEVRGDLETILLRSLAKDPARRYQSADQLGSEVRRFLAGDAIEARRDSAWYMLRKALRRYRWPAIAIGTATVAIVIFSVVVSILYTKVKAARATGDAKMNVVRDSQDYLTHKLYQQQRSDNFLSIIDAQYPSVAANIGLDRAPSVALLNRIADFTELVPDCVRQVALSPNMTLTPETRAWLAIHRDELDQIAESLRIESVPFTELRKNTENFIIGEFHDWLHTVETMCDCLAVAGLNFYTQQDDIRSIRMFNALRFLSFDQAAGPMLFDKLYAIKNRTRSYTALTEILNRCVLEGRSVEPYVEWIVGDPPLPELRSAFIELRQRHVQVFEQATKAGTSGEPWVDWQQLEDSFGETLPRGAAHSKFRLQLEGVTTAEIVQMFDLYAGELETWEGLTVDELAGHASQLFTKLQQHKAWPEIFGFFSAGSPMFQKKLQAEATRKGVQLAAGLCQYYQTHGEWPSTLQAVYPPIVGFDDRDPLTGHPLIYRRSEDGMLLYSTNNDGLDDGGNAGAWGEPGCDVILFSATSRSTPID